MRISELDATYQSDCGTDFFVRVRFQTSEVPCSPCSLRCLHPRKTRFQVFILRVFHIPAIRQGGIAPQLVALPCDAFLSDHSFLRVLSMRRRVGLSYGPMT